MSQPSPAEKLRHDAARRLALPPTAKPAERLAVYKRFLKLEEHRLQLWHRRGAGGRELAHARTQLIDLLLENLFAAAHAAAPRAAGTPPPAFALVAIGGFGRGELCPYSDVDLMFLHNLSAREVAAQPYVTFVVEQLLYALWDLGLKVGHSTRSLDEAIVQANRDLRSKTALIESRRVLGDAALYEQFRQALLRQCVRGQEDAYIDQRMRDQAARHEKYGDSVFLQEPDVKSGCGGLRDFQNLIWMAFFKYGARSLPELRRLKFLEAAEQHELTEAYDFILRVRHTLHYLTSRPHETISLNLQPQVADRLGYRQHDLLRRTETLMRDYYQHARTVFLLTNALAERLALKPPRFARLGALLGRRARPELVDGFAIDHGLIEAAHPKVFHEQPARLLRVFLLAQQRGVEFSPALRTQLRQHLRLIDRAFRAAAEPRDTFLAILQQKGQVAHTLRLMHETEVLGRYLPEFGQLTCLVQHEFFHRYTADEHTLQVIAHLDQILDATAPPHLTYQRLFRQLDRAPMLYLAVLLHDVGKAANVDHHVEASLEGARRVAARLRLAEDDTNLLLFLVRDHLKLSLLSQRRDIDDQATIDAAARIVQQEGRLDALMLLTFADSIGTSVKSWSEWKQALLWGLYHHTKQALAGPERARHILARRIEHLYKETSSRLRQELPLEEIYSHFELMPASYYLRTSTDQIAQHLRLIHRFLERQQAVEKPADALAPLVEWQSFPAQRYSQVAVCSWDRLGLFSKICGALASAELNILRAQIYTRGDHVVLDLLDVCDRDLHAVTDPKAVQTAERTLDRTLTQQEEINLPELLERIRSRQRPAVTPRDVTIPTLIEFDNDISASRTVIEVQAANRLGLLYTLTKTISDLNLDISISNIATEKGAAIDSFYVQDQDGGKITDAARLAQAKEKLLAALELMGR